MTIDAHHHLWKYNAAEYGWITPEQRVIRRDFLPEDLEPLMHHFGIEGTVAVQARQTLEETAWLLGLARAICREPQAARRPPFDSGRIRSALHSAQGFQ
jgi:predicted TIM-barrel fold metal-dependent hydrolase